jgi:hypothetical protein
MTNNTARPIEEWNEEMGNVLWWRFPVEEPPYVGTPNDLGHEVVIAVGYPHEDVKTYTHNVGGWPGYHTHFTPIEVPEEPKAIEKVVDEVSEAIARLFGSPYGRYLLTGCADTYTVGTASEDENSQGTGVFHTVWGADGTMTTYEVNSSGKLVFREEQHMSKEEQLARMLKGMSDLCRSTRACVTLADNANGN